MPNDELPIENGTPGETAQADAAQSEPSPEDRLAELNDKHLRLLAELRNVTVRAQREKSEALRFAEFDFARELLTPLDDLERALEAAGPDAAGPFVEGVRIARDHFLKILKSRGVEPIEAAGQPFDPSRHEALLQQPSAAHPPGTVLQEVGRGFRMHDRVLRTAKVIVSTAP